MAGRKYVIVGNGVAGVTAAQSIVQADPAAEVHIFGAEPYPYYQRPRLLEFLAGEIEVAKLVSRPPEWYAAKGIQVHLGARVTALDPAEHRLTLADESSVSYDRLLLATGGRPFVPPFAGIDKSGVFTLRTLDDARAMKVYAGDARNAVVIGGGLLGLETARALLSLRLDVTVIEFAPRLLPRQLDVEGAQVLQARLEALGLRILTNAATEAILGNERATGVQLKTRPEHSRRDERVVDGELVLISTGIRSRVELAQEAGLEMHHGVLVDGQLRTSATDVYAAGDVAEFEGIVYGIIPAAIEQARVAAANMVSQNGGGVIYSGTVPATTLKVAGIDLACLGDATATGDELVVLRQVDPATGVYRRLALRDGKIVGAILLGDIRNVQPLKQLIATGRDVSAYSQQLPDGSLDLKALAQGLP
ncbi:MAG TPA: NAD(P)/FAD-dependent oxidoreductase [Anaerolineae bacterium]|nr:NAD(P)/FAD-dependent oxidoreductase [Anaerolineae bacterium]